MRDVQRPESRPSAGFFLGAVLVSLLGACGTSESRAAARWSGTMDTLPSGQVAVQNTAAPVWLPGEEWQVVETVRIGTIEGSGPELFGQIASLDVDALGRLWILERQARELRVFDGNGAHVRTIGRSGGGPGEFATPLKVARAPNDDMWVVDPQNNRISVFDTTGAYREGKIIAGGFIMMPWPGRFDDAGYYYAPIPTRSAGRFEIVQVRFDTALVPLDTLLQPDDPLPRERFELTSGDGRMIAGVPFQGSLINRLSPAGTQWALLTDHYRLFEVTAQGDTLRTITRPFTPMPVTEADRESAREDMEWFVSQGGQVDWSKLPSVKPSAESFFFDDEGRVWVQLIANGEDASRLVDVFDPEGRWLGTVRLPFPLSDSPFPLIRNSLLYGVTEDELGVQYVVVARIVRPAG
ncbi:MAG: 6-bladed beta-propeller [Gemmatimonadetes bacterium]|nr:6-bladed beta-propeller [Gemmatimonadota bacterium]